MSKVILNCVYEIYDRCYDSALERVYISGPTVRACLFKLLDVVDSWATVDDILETEEENGEKFTTSELLEYIEERNGDGCDYIAYIADDVSGEVLMGSLSDVFPETNYDADEYAEV